MSFLVATQTIQRYNILIIFVLHCLTRYRCTFPRSLGTLSVLFGQVVRGMAAGSRIFEYMELHPSVPLVGGTKIPVSEIEGRVEFRNIQFSYPGRPGQVCVLLFPCRGGQPCLAFHCHMINGLQNYLCCVKWDRELFDCQNQKCTSC